MGLLLCYFLGKWDPGVLPPCLSPLEAFRLTKIPNRELCSFETVSRALLG